MLGGIHSVMAISESDPTARLCLVVPLPQVHLGLHPSDSGHHSQRLGADYNDALAAASLGKAHVLGRIDNTDYILKPADRFDPVLLGIPAPPAASETPLRLIRRAVPYNDLQVGLIAAGGADRAMYRRCASAAAKDESDLHPITTHACPCVLPIRLQTGIGLDFS
jgi:hypothetical protein